MANKALGSNPLFDTDKKNDGDLFDDAAVAAIRADQLKDSVTHDWTTATFKMNKQTLKKLRDYAYTERIELKIALDQALTEFFDNHSDMELLEAPEKLRNTRKRGN